MNALAKEGPLGIAVAAGDWFSYEKGVFDNFGSTTINHAVFLVGYGTDEKTGEDFYLIRNSWGSEFGEQGYIRVKRTDNDSNLCKTDNEPLEGIACQLDDNGNKVDVKPVTICGTSGVLFDAAYPVGVHLKE